jgi:acyl-coenzyme A thioesterase PaaI-like protein
MPSLIALPSALIRNGGLPELSTRSLWEKAQSLPAGKTIFVRALTLKAPYFGSIHPRIEALRAGHCEVTIKDRRSVHNHLGTVHAIAMCNMAELAGGMATEAAVPKSARWIPKGMTVEYLRKARGPLRAVADLEPIPDFADGAEVIATVKISDESGVEVVRAAITMHVSPRPMSD